MSIEIVAFMLGVSLVLGLCGLLGFLWGVKNGQFDDENKMMEGVLFDSEEELNRLASLTNPADKQDFLQKLQKENNMNEVYDLVVIGAGPGGIASAAELKSLGIDKILLLEKSENNTSTIRNFYKDNKRVDKDYKGQVVDLIGNIAFSDGDKESTLDLFDEVLRNINVKTKCDVEKVIKNGEIFDIYTSANEIFKAKFVVISIGKMGQPNKPEYKIPLTIRAKVQFNANGINPDEKLLIVGGGNSAVEYANALCASNDCTLNYRRTEFNRINETNATELKKNLESGKLKGILGIDIEGLEDADSKVKVNFKNGKSEIFDRVIYAIGGAAPTDFLTKSNIQVDESGTPKTTNQESNIKNLFIAGDIALKSGGSIANALNHGRIIALEIKKRLG